MSSSTSPAIVSGEAEADFDKGYRVNLDGTRLLLDAIRRPGARTARGVVFASSIAVFGAPFPDVIGDDHADAADELRDAEGDRRAAARRTTAGAGSSTASGSACRRSACGRAAPNRAASGFFSSIIREPLNGEEAVLPVPDEVRHWFASPRAAVGFLLHAAAIDDRRRSATAAA